MFRRIWLASLLSNLGFMILSVGAGWTMTELTTSADMIALIQTALMLPMMLLSLRAGAIADMYDRRKVGLFALCLPPERIDRAVHAGIRYVFYSHPLRAVLIRTFAIGIAGGSVSALMPLVARDLVHGQAQIYGLMLAAFGIGSVIGALGIARVRRHLRNEAATAAFTLLIALCVAGVALSRSTIVTIPMLLGAGIGWMVCLTLCNVAVQTAVPRWVTGRAVAAFQTAIAGGLAMGSWLWGQVVQAHGVSAALLASAAALALTLLVALV